MSREVRFQFISDEGAHDAKLVVDHDADSGEWWILQIDLDADGQPWNATPIRRVPNQLFGEVLLERCEREADFSAACLDRQLSATEYSEIYGEDPSDDLPECDGEDCGWCS